MAMLAEPRRRKRYNLCPRGKALYEDDSRFGTKMLEKMGWSKGRGLGANEDGAQEFVRIRFKNDAEGLGYESRDDQWTIHEEGFNGLLKELNGDENPTTNETNGHASESSEEETRPLGFGFKAEPKPKAEPQKPKTLKENISGVSLEEKSKFSKARVHYKKFTRGKDLAQYSEKDLANIFGKKATEDFVVPVIAPTVPTAEIEEKPVNDNFAGVQTVSTGLSVNDYFRLKMEALKNKSKANHLKQEPTEKINDKEQQETELMEDHDAVKKKKKKSKKQEEAKEEVLEIKAKETIKKKSKELPEELTVAKVEQEPKKKKSKHVQEVPEEALAVGEAEQEQAPKKKKKKKSKDADQEVAEVLEMELTEEKQEEVLETAAQLKKKKKSKQDKEVPEEDKRRLEKKSKRAKKEAIKQEDEVDTDSVNTEKKKLKMNIEIIEKTNCKRAGEQEIPARLEEAEETNPPKRKKKKKDKRDKAEQLKKEETTEKVKKIKENEAEIEKTQKQTERNKAQDKEDSNCEEKTTENSQKKHNSNVSAKCDATNLKLDSDNYLSYEQLIQLRDSFNICTISTFCAEKFHLFDMKAFKNSSLPQIVGYNVDENIQLKVVKTNSDALRIIGLWEGTSNKYTRDKDAETKLKKTKHKAAVRANKRRQYFSVI